MVQGTYLFRSRFFASSGDIPSLAQSTPGVTRNGLLSFAMIPNAVGICTK